MMSNNGVTDIQQDDDELRTSVVNELNSSEQVVTEKTGENSGEYSENITEVIEKDADNNVSTDKPKNQNDFDKQMLEKKWVKDRLRRQEAQFEGKVNDIKNQLTQYQNLVNNVISAPPVQNTGYYDPVANNYIPNYQGYNSAIGQTSVQDQGNNVDQLINSKVEEALKKAEQQREEARLREEMERLNKSHDDFEDMIYELKSYLTPEMAFAIKNLSLENVYKAWKKNPQEIRAVSSMPRSQQVIALARLEAKAMLESQVNIAKSPDKKTITPLNTNSGSAADVLIDDLTAAVERRLKNNR